MAYIISAIVLVGLLCVANLMLVYGVIRRLREHSDLLSKESGSTRFENATLPVGAMVGEFTSTTTEGVVKTKDHLLGETLVGFFTLSCATCKDELPRFVRRADDFPGGRDHVLAVVLEDGADAGDMAAELSGVAHVVLAENPMSDIATAFHVTAFPAFFVLSHGVVKSVDFKADAFPVLLAS